MSSHDLEHSAAEARSRRRGSRAAGLRLLRSAAVIYLLICLLMMMAEPSLVYLPPPPQAEFPWSKRFEAEEVWLRAEDRTRLHGWYLPHAQPRAAICYYHGNAEDAERNVSLMAALRDRLQASVLIVDYRGYGLSAGSPHEAGLIADGIAAQRWLANRMGIAPEEIVLYGRSLGGGVAVAAAEQLGARALILHGTFAELTEVAANSFPWLPIRLLMRNRYPSKERIQNYDGPLLQLHGTADRVVPIELAKPLFLAAPGGPKQFVELVGSTHNDPLPKRGYDTIVDFLDSLPPVAHP